MSFGNKNKDTGPSKREQQQAQQNALRAAQPSSFYSPFGNVVVQDKKINLDPMQSATQTATSGLTDEKLFNLMGGVPDNITVDDIYQNPFYQNTLDLIQPKTDQQFSLMGEEMNNQLAARNQLGSSFEALQRDKFNRLKQDAYQQNEATARQASADAFSNSNAQLLNALQILRGDRSQALEAAFAPAKIATGYQSALTPLAGAQADIYQAIPYQQRQQSPGFFGNTDWGQMARAGAQIAAMF